ncbi:MAG: N-acetylmuramoyl-L-alanine amidase [Paracoccaceae bacterium]|nr:N-acetylmuramoyl-L-alanine amidase [Paracoccaceae bacterium]
MIRLLTSLTACFWAALSAPGVADDLSALARLEAEGSAVIDTAEGTEVTLALTQPVPWRLFTVDGPPRLVLDFRSITQFADVAVTSTLASGPDIGLSADGWSRLVFALSEPAAVGTAAMARRDDGGALVSLRLHPTDAATFRETARVLPEAAGAERQGDKSRPVVVLDPGHGGIDPGAEAGGLNEKTLMLAFARELEETIIRGGLFDVALTRDADEFVPLETRISRARAAGADVFLSLHADELPEGAGAASGITVYTLAETASDAASRRLAERHDKNDLLTGVSATGPGDEIALVLMDIARTDTTPRSAALAATLKSAFRAEDLALVGRPLRSAAFSVLKAADFPSALIELGFLSSEKDRARLTDPVWRQAAVRAIEAALVQWALDDAAQAPLRRR